MAAACLATSTSLAGQPTSQRPGAADQDPRTGIRIVLDNARVRVFKASTALAVVDHPAAVVVVLEDGGARKAGDAYWSGDPAVPENPSGGDVGSLIIVEPKESASPHTPAPRPPDAGTRPGETVFKGMSFKPLFDNERVTVIRGRMEVGAQEGFHTHASDIVVVHLSGGAIEDTADGKTKVNHWKHGDVEFEARGSSHSARNVGPALDAVLVTLKP
jgi:quercetin dioxygenase-like cupin family protein